MCQWYLASLESVILIDRDCLKGDFMKVTFICVLCFFGFSGCALWPLPPNYTTVDAQKAASIPSDTSIDIDGAKKLINGWLNIYEDAALGRRRWQLGFSEVLFYGSILAVGGSATHHDRLRNVGIGLAGSSSLLNGHYKIDEQLAAFRKAIGRLACMEEATVQIVQQDVALFEISDAKMHKATVDLPVTLFQYVNRVRRELGNALNSIVLAALTQKEIYDAYQKYLDEAKRVDALSGTLSNNEKNKISNIAALREQIVALRAEHTKLTASESNQSKIAVQQSAIASKEAELQRIEQRMELRKKVYLNAVLGIDEKLELCFKS